jgi:hypothetical protein
MIEPLNLIALLVAVLGFVLLEVMLGLVGSGILLPSVRRWLDRWRDGR